MTMPRLAIPARDFDPEERNRQHLRRQLRQERFPPEDVEEGEEPDLAVYIDPPDRMRRDRQSASVYPMP